LNPEEEGEQKDKRTASFFNDDDASFVTFIHNLNE
jgi:hypothetical protein